VRVKNKTRCRWQDRCHRLSLGLALEPNQYPGMRSKPRCHQFATEVYRPVARMEA
jgi:hypothetical protein